MSILALLWKFRYPLAVLVLLAGAGYVKYVFDDRADLKGQVAEAMKRNQSISNAYAALGREKERSEKLLGKRAERKAKEADQLGAIVQNVLSKEKTNACASSPAIRALLDGLRQQPAD